jgi:hypothetical protein
MVAFVAWNTHTQLMKKKNKNKQKNYLGLDYLSLVATVFFLPPLFLSHTHTPKLSRALVMELKCFCSMKIG